MKSQPNCLECQSGHIADDDHTGCVGCPAGTYVGDNGCVLCSGRRYQPDIGGGHNSGSCITCDPGYSQIIYIHNVLYVQLVRHRVAPGV